MDTPRDTRPRALRALAFFLILASLGLALLQQKKPVDAIAHLQEAAKLAPGDEKTWLYLGLAADDIQPLKKAA